MEKFDIIRKIFEDENDVTFKKGDKLNEVLVIINDCPIKKTFYCYDYNFEETMNKLEKYIKDCKKLIGKDINETLSYNDAIEYIEWQSIIHSIKIYGTYDKNIIFNKPDIKGYFIININDIILTKKSINCFFDKMIMDFDNGNYIKDFNAIYMDTPNSPLNDNYLSLDYPVTAGVNKKFYYYWVKGNGQKRYITKSDFDYLRHLKFMANKDIEDVLRYNIMHGMSGNFSITKTEDVPLMDGCTEYRVTSNIGHSVGSFIVFLEQFTDIFGKIYIEAISNKEVYFYVKN